MTEQNNARFALAVLFSINAMNFYDRLIPAAVGQSIKDEWGLSDTALGGLGTAFILLYATVGIPLGRLSDHFSRRKLLAVGVFFWSLLTAASGFAKNFPQLVALRLSVGVGEATCAPASTSLIGDLFPPRQRARALSLFMMGLPIGNALCFFISGIVMSHYSWKAAFYVALIPGLLCTLGALFIREPARGSSETHSVGGLKREGSPYWLVLKTPTMRWIILSGAVHNFNMYALGTFLVPFLIRTHHCDPGLANSLATWIYGLSGIPGLILGGLMGDRTGRINGRMIIAAAAIAIATPFIYFGLSTPAGEVNTVTVLLAVGCMMFYLYYSTVYSTIQDVIEPSLRGTAMALYFFAMYLLGGALGPIGMGRLSDYYARSAAASEGVALDGLTGPALVEALKPFAGAGLHSALYIVPVMCVILAAVLAAGARTVTKDAEHLRNWMQNSANGGSSANDTVADSLDAAPSLVGKTNAS